LRLGSLPNAQLRTALLPRPSYGCTMRRPDLLADKWIPLAEAVRRIAGPACADKVDDVKGKRRAAADKLYEALRRGDVQSRAGRVRKGEGDFDQPGSIWALANWPIPASVWQVITVYHWDRNSADTWIWPANERDRLPLLAARGGLASEVRIVRPTPQPSRFCAPNSATCRTIRHWRQRLAENSRRCL
jgi:hypothetical protein